MKLHRITALVTLSAITLMSQAQTAPASTAPTPEAPAPRAERALQRDVNQEARIRDGLQSGQLNTREGALLQREQAHVDRMQSNALRDGKVSRAEAARINAAQNKASRDINRADNNGVNGNPLSASSQRMQGAAQRDINQQTRIRNGVEQRQLTNGEAARLERGQARTDAKEFRAGRDGRVGAAEAVRVNRAQDAQSTRIHSLRHNAAARKG